MDNLKILSMEYELLIKEFIESKYNEEPLRDKYPNLLIKEDVLDLLDEFCTVVYYPLTDQNHGFHITDIPFSDGNKRPFVFINTAQTAEKQAFTAAHELGHLWGVDDYVCSKLSIKAPSNDIREGIINRFAAVLLMPHDVFVKSTIEILKTFDNGSNRVDFLEFLKLIAMLMNRFFAPMKSVVRRLLEVGIIHEESAALLLDVDDVTKVEIERLMQQIYTKLGYIKFKDPTNKRWIEGLAEQLDKAERKGLVAQTKIDNMRARFGLDKPTPVERRDVFTLDTSKGVDDSAT